MQPRSLFCIGLAITVCALLVIALIPSPRQDAAVLERLAPRIERAQTLAPETRDAIMQLVERVRETGDPRHQVRRELAIQRVTDALNVKDGLVNTGQGAPRPSPTLTSSP